MNNNKKTKQQLIQELERSQTEQIITEKVLRTRKENISIPFEDDNRYSTDHKQVEKAPRYSQNMLQTVLDSIPSAVFWKDRDSIYLGGNRTWLEAAGLKSSEEVVGKSDYDLPWEKEQADSFREDDRKVIETGIPEYNIIEPYVRADGIHAWAKTNKVPLRDTEGNIVGVLGTYEDITENKRAEEALRESEEKYRLLFDTMLNGSAYCKMIYDKTNL